DPPLLLGKRLAAGKAEVAVAAHERREALRVARLDVGERLVGPVAGVGLGKSRVDARLEPEALADDSRRLQRPRQRAGPQRDDVAACRRDLRERIRLRAPGVVQGHRELALEARLAVVGRLPVTG